MKYLKLLLLVLPFICFSCGSEDEPEPNLFSLAVQLDGEGKIALGSHDCDVEIPSNAQTVKLSLIGDFDYFNISAGYPSWMTVTSTEKTILVDIPANESNENRSGKIYFTVFKGNSHNVGSLGITQKDSQQTYEDRLKLEEDAINSFLADITVISEIPSDYNFRIGSDAPFYKLGDTGAYMQIVSKGNPQFKLGEKVFFRFERWNLLLYLISGNLGESTGNFNSLTQDVTFFTYGGNDNITKQWGKGIQLPLEYGLGSGSEVNLIIPSQLGFESDVSSVIPFLYHIRYYSAAN